MNPKAGPLTLTAESWSTDGHVGTNLSCLSCASPSAVSTCLLPPAPPPGSPLGGDHIVGGEKATSGPAKRVPYFSANDNLQGPGGGRVWTPRVSPPASRVSQTNSTGACFFLIFIDLAMPGAERKTFDPRSPPSLVPRPQRWRSAPRSSWN